MDGVVTAATTVTTSTSYNGSAAGTFNNAGSGAGGVFDADDYLDLSSPISFVDDFSIAYWVSLPADASTNPRGIFDFSGNGGDGPQSLFIQGGAPAGNMAFRVDGSGTSNSLVFITVPEDGTWFHVAATYDEDGMMDVYIDGVLAASAAGVTQAAWSTDQYIGAFNVSATATHRGTGGSIDDFRIYSDLLTPAEILALATIPEPSTTALGLLALGFLARRRRS